MPESMRLANECKADRVDQFYAALHESAYGPNRTCPSRSTMSAFGGKADIDHPVLIEGAAGGSHVRPSSPAAPLQNLEKIDHVRRVEETIARIAVVRRQPVLDHVLNRECEVFQSLISTEVFGFTVRVPLVQQSYLRQESIR